MSSKKYAVAVKIREGYRSQLPWYERAALWMSGEWRWLGEDVGGVGRIDDRSAIMLSNAKRFTQAEAKRVATDIERKNPELKSAYIDVEKLPLHLKAAMLLTGRY